MHPKSHVRSFSLSITHFLVGVIVVLSTVGYCPAKMRDGIVPEVDRYLTSLGSLNTQNQSIPVFEQYGAVSTDSEKAILDNFAIQLLDNQDLTGYVVLRRGQQSSKSVARKLRYIKDYLIKKRGVPAKRVSAFEGKSRHDYGVELYLVSKGKPGPS